MKRFMFTILMVALMTMATSAIAGPYDFTASVYRAKSTTTGDVVLTEATTGITYQVLTAGSDTIATVTAFGDDAATAKTNPVTTTVFAADGGKIRFRGNSVTSVDIIVTDTVGGYARVIESFSVYDHKIVINENLNESHHGLVPYSCASVAERDTGVDFGYDTNINTVIPEIVTTSTGGTIDVGLLSSETNGDANGFLDTETAATAGFPAPALADTGAFLDDATNYYPSGHFVTGANATSLTYTCSTTGNSGAGYLHYFLSKVR